MIQSIGACNCARPRAIAPTLESGWEKQKKKTNVLTVELCHAIERIFSFLFRSLRLVLAFVCVARARESCPSDLIH